VTHPVLVLLGRPERDVEPPAGLHGVPRGAQELRGVREVLETVNSDSTTSTGPREETGAKVKRTRSRDPESYRVRGAAPSYLGVKSTPMESVAPGRAIPTVCRPVPYPRSRQNLPGQPLADVRKTRAAAAGGSVRLASSSASACRPHRRRRRRARVGHCSRAWRVCAAMGDRWAGRIESRVVHAWGWASLASEKGHPAGR
jgi:hypothetical protein